MNTIVCNTLVGAVTEYDWPAFQSITPTHAGGAAGLFSLGGDTDAGLPIVSKVMTGQLQMDAKQRKRIPDVYYALTGPVRATCVVATESGEYAYPFQVRKPGVSRAIPGKGIVSPYLQVGLRTNGDSFLLDYIEAEVATSTRRI